MVAIEGAALATAATTGAVTALFKSATDSLSSTVKGPARTAFVKAIASLQGYSDYIEETHERVSTFKTFANPTRPVNVLDHFVTTKFTDNGKRRPIDQEVIINRLKKPTRIVVSATAGFGKSMVMRYIALALFENPMGKIPLFLELRHLNRVTNPDIITYINASYRRISAIDVENLRQGLSSGAFVLLLDGFDELSHEIRPIVEQQILEISRDFPRCSIVVSGRPDDRFYSWKSFTLLKVCPMEQAEVIELINKLDYDRGVRQRFIKQVKSGLYETHNSFLSTPLLAILMLLTYEQNANIPDKIYLFYGKAFETLFHKHDALKEQYSRSRKSPLQVDEFERIFSVFCLKTYVEEKTEFTQSEILSNIRDAISYEGLDIKAEDFLFDIEESLCLIMKEGASYFFVHRSFQEYFTAKFLSSCAEDVRDQFIDEVSNRYWDSVLPMLFDMAASQLVPTWVSRKCEAYLKAVGFDEGKIDPIDARIIGVGFWKHNENFHINNFIFGPHFRFISTMMRFYPEVGHAGRILFDKLETFVKANWDQIPFIKEQVVNLKDGKAYLREFALKSLPQNILDDCKIVDMANSEYQCIVKIESGLDKDQKVKNDFLNKIFGKT